MTIASNPLAAEMMKGVELVYTELYVMGDVIATQDLNDEDKDMF